MLCRSVDLYCCNNVDRVLRIQQDENIVTPAPQGARSRQHNREPIARAQPEARSRDRAGGAGASERARRHGRKQSSPAALRASPAAQPKERARRCDRKRARPTARQQAIESGAAASEPDGALAGKSEQTPVHTTE
jgi:hypothetical protein